jgi:hypothetical protein
MLVPIVLYHSNLFNLMRPFLQFSGDAIVRVFYKQTLKSSITLCSWFNISWVLSRGYEFQPTLNLFLFVHMVIQIYSSFQPFTYFM